MVLFTRIHDTVIQFKYYCIEFNSAHSIQARSVAPRRLVR